MQAREIIIKDTKLVVRNLDRDDLNQVCALSMLHGWTSSSEDIQVMFDTQPKAFIGIFREDNKLVGHIAVFLLDDKRAYIGIVVVSKVMQGYGLGKILMAEATDRVGARDVSLDSTSDAQSFYRKMGFRNSPIQTLSFTGKRKRIENLEELSPNVIIKDVKNKADISQVFDYDMKICKFVRHKHLQKWLAPSPFCFSHVAFEKQDGRCVGYVSARKLDAGIYKLQPLYADSVEIATALFQHLVTNCPFGDDVMFRLYPTKQAMPHAREFSRLNGLHEEGAVSDFRMVKGQDEVIDWRCVYSTSNTTSTAL
ncbi:hypothetical protein CAPTEDRAFT_214428 [Capitella teleta]|uniref:N-acetyltransferase domain-containing protein n=1 Tax=Capitella teleta TaxID=283909 RepID=R7UYG8_CAPTE|nr:hypothetical protein CAPTEDRAFT_214428 [Capitella teleta]|eukprot:ELU08982.1 hypothetical protein CAPTEDRAFT_214428 [Capitella teleta]